MNTVKHASIMHVPSAIKPLVAILGFTLGILLTGCSPGESASADMNGSTPRAGDAMDPDRLHGWVRDLTEFQPRWAGYPQEEMAGEWLAQRLTDAGVDTQVHPYPMRKWEFSDWEVNIIEDGVPVRLNSFPMWSTRAGEGTAEMVDVGLGTEPELLAKDLNGKVAVVTGRALINVFATYPDTYHRAAELGAVAMFVTSDAPDNLIRPTSSGKNLQDENAIPAFQLGARDLARLRQAAQTGGQASWKLSAKHVDGTTRDVVGHLPGSGELPGTILICAHYDAWFSGALDNATGVSGLIGLAEHFASLPKEQRPRDMIFLGVTGHDAGYPYGGVQNWVKENESLIPDIDLFVNLDHLAAHGEEHISGTGIIDMLGLTVERPGDEERALFTTQHPTLALTFLPSLVQYGLLAAVLPTIPEVNANPDLEGTMGALGVPSVNLSMATPHYHTVEDTADRIPPEQLSRSVAAHRDFITSIMSMSRQQIRFPQ